MGPTAPAQEAANLAFVERWVELHNTDPLRMVEECYAPDAVIEVPGVDWFGVERLRALEVGVAASNVGAADHRGGRDRGGGRCHNDAVGRQARSGGAWCSPSAME